MYPAKEHKSSFGIFFFFFGYRLCFDVPKGSGKGSQSVRALVKGKGTQKIIIIKTRTKYEKEKRKTLSKGSFGALPLSLHPLSLPQKKKKPEKGKKTPVANGRGKINHAEI